VAWARSTRRRSPRRTSASAARACGATPACGCRRSSPPPASARLWLISITPSVAPAGEEASARARADSSRTTAERSDLWRRPRPRWRGGGAGQLIRSLFLLPLAARRAGSAPACLLHSSRELVPLVSGSLPPRPGLDLLRVHLAAASQGDGNGLLERLGILEVVEGREAIHHALGGGEQSKHSEAGPALGELAHDGPVRASPRRSCARCQS